jgi:phosphatidate phosphatase APP1
MLACLNINISDKMIMWMLENGANKNYKHSLNGCKISIINDLDDTISQKRINNIKNIFYEHDMKHINKINSNILIGKFFYKLKYNLFL